MVTDMITWKHPIVPPGKIFSSRARTSVIFANRTCGLHRKRLNLEGSALPTLSFDKVRIQCTREEQFSVPLQVPFDRK